MLKESDPLFIKFDLFAGFGGTALGDEQAEINGDRICKVIGCINHDELAINNHRLNFPHITHFKEDVRNVDLAELKSLADFQRQLHPKALLVLSASLPCPHFSKALGNKPKDENIRTLGYSLYMKYDHLNEKHYEGDSYIQVLDPDIIIIENVEEFLSWGPLNDNNRPITKMNGQEWMKWKEGICSLGYRCEWRELDSANYGAFTRRNRLFIIFAKPGVPIAWPEATHAKEVVGGMFGSLQKWKAVRDVLDLNDTGESIINRKKKLADKTIFGLIKGIKKFAFDADGYFLYHYYGNSYSSSINSPCPAFRTKQSAYLIQVFIHNPSHGGNCSSADIPSPVIVARQDKAPLRMVTCIKGKSRYKILKSDSLAYKELKRLMKELDISEVLYRPLRTKEKLVIQGFPKYYKMEGTQGAQEKQIGNSVVPIVEQRIMEALGNKLIDFKKTKVA